MPVADNPRIPLDVAKIRKLRIDAKLTHAEASERAGLTGKHVWSDLENGRRSNLTIKVLDRVARALGCCARDLLLKRRRGTIPAMTRHIPDENPGEAAKRKADEFVDSLSDLTPEEKAYAKDEGLRIIRMWMTAQGGGRTENLRVRAAVAAFAYALKTMEEGGYQSSD
jgi:transcriptional regulator with XRE-family HTH domain